MFIHYLCFIKSICISYTVFDVDTLWFVDQLIDTFLFPCNPFDDVNNLLNKQFIHVSS